MRPRASRCRTAARASRSAAGPGRLSSRRVLAKPLSGERVCKRQFGRGQKRQGVTPSASRRPAPVVICKPSFRGTHSPRVLRDGFALRAGFPRRAGGHCSEREDQFLVHRRAGEPCPRCGHTIRKIVGGTCTSRPTRGRLPRGRAAGGDAGGVAGAGPPAGDGGRREGRRRRAGRALGAGRAGGASRTGGTGRAGGRVGPEVRVGPGGRVVPGPSRRPPDVKRAKAPHIAAAECT